MAPKPTKHAVSFIIYNNDRSQFVAVKRPSNDEDLPDVWGLPAGSVKEGETSEEAVIRAGREKLGVELRPVRVIGEGKTERNSYILHMKDYEVEILQGEPRVPQPVEDITQYQDWKWATCDDLIEAAEKGSLCSRIYLHNEARSSSLSGQREVRHEQPE